MSFSVPSTKPAAPVAATVPGHTGLADPDGLRLEIYAASGIEGRAPVEGVPSCGFF
jgi:hypothetical protein